ncbi:hypothetical protein BH20ACI2_BH20ACI2_07650 [soil metagenome]
MSGVLFNKYLTTLEIDAGIGGVLEDPKETGRLELIVCRPAVGKREILPTGYLDSEQGLIGDNWLKRGSSRTSNGRGHPEMQLTIMNYRFAMLIAGSPHRVPFAGDQLFVDLNLSGENLPPGSHLLIGSTAVEVTAIPHLGCKNFVERFGLDAMRFANSDFGRKHHLRGINARVIESGPIKQGDAVRRIPQ